MADLGVSAISIIPSFKGIRGKVERAGKDAGQQFGRAFENPISRTLGGRAIAQTAAAAKQAARQVSDAKKREAEAVKLVARAEQKLQAARASAAASGARVTGAEERLETVRRKHAAAISEVQAAEKRAVAARDLYGAKSKQAAAAERQLGMARDKAAAEAGQIRVAEQKIVAARAQSKARTTAAKIAENSLVNSRRVLVTETETLAAATSRLAAANSAATAAAAGGGVVNLAGAGAATQKMRAFSGAASGLGASAVAAGASLRSGLTLPLGVVGVSAVTAGARFEKSMNRVAAVSGATGADFEKLRKQAKELGAITKFSASQAADGMGFLAMAGFKTNEIYESMPSVLQLAASANMELGEAADITSNILTGYGLKTKDLAHANDVLVKSFTGANVDLSMLGETMKYMGPVMAGFGFSFEESAAAAGMLGNAGIQASMAGTSLRQAMVRLMNPVGQATEVMKRLGLNVKDSRGQLLPLHEILRRLEKSGATAGDMMALFGERAGPSMIALTKQGSGALKKFTEELEKSGGTAERVSRVQMRGLSGSFTELKSAAEGAAIAWGESGSLGMLEKMVKRLTAKMQELNKTSPKILQGITLMGVGLLALGPTVSIFGNLSKAAGGLGKALNFVTGKVGGLSGVFALLKTGPGLIILGIVAAVAALTAGFIYLWNTSKPFKDFFINLWEKISEKAQKFSAWFLETFWPNIRGIFMGIGDLFGAVWGFIKTIWDTIGRPVFNSIMMLLSFLVPVWQKVWGFMQVYIGIVWNLIAGYVRVGIAVVSGIIKTVTALMKGDWRAAWDAIKNTARRVWDAIKDTLSGMVGSFKAVPADIRRFFSNAGSWLYNSGKRVITGFIDGVRSKLGAITSTFNEVTSRAAAFMPNSPAKRGAFSGRGWTPHRGRALMEGFAEGIDARAGLPAARVAAAMDTTANRFNPETSSHQNTATTRHGDPGGMVFNLSVPSSDQRDLVATIMSAVRAANLGAAHV